MDTSINRIFYGHVPTPNDTKITCRLKYLLEESWDISESDWVVEILVNHDLEGSWKEDGLSLLPYGRKDEETEHWFSSDSLSRSMAVSFYINKESREFLNDALEFLQQEIPAPDTRVVDEEYIDEHRNLEEYENYLRSPDTSGLPNSVPTQSLSEDEIQEKLRRRREENKRRIGKTEFDARPLHYGIHELEYVMKKVEEGHSLGESALTEERLEDYRKKRRAAIEKWNQQIRS